MNYSDAIEYIRENAALGAVLGLSNIRNLCHELDNPQRGLNIIHIAGTNGKGSVGAFCQSILTHAGYDVCRFVSPPVFAYEEILSFNGVNMTPDETAFYISAVKSAADALVSDGLPQPTAFELETAMAFLYCRDKNCDFAILESGMGGALDAVNIIETPRVCVLTSIGLDHQRFLGETLAEIARAKAGIIKNGALVVSAPQPEPAADIIAAAARAAHSRLVVADEPTNIRENRFDYDDLQDLEISLRGAFQPINAAVAVEVCSELGIHESDIRCGLKNARWRGRFETICSDPTFIIDGAHNADAALMLEKTVKSEFDGRKINFIIGVLADKDYEEIIARTAYLAEKIYTVTPDSPRALDGSALADTVRGFNKNVAFTSVYDAVKRCLADSGAVTIAFGSLSYLKDVVKAVQNEKN